MGPATLTVWAVLIAIALLGMILVGNALRVRGGRVCPDEKCRFINASDAHYCGRCGHALPTEGPPEQ